MKRAAPARPGLPSGDAPLVYIATTRTGAVAYGVRANGDARALRAARLQAQREFHALRQYLAQQSDDPKLTARLVRSVRAVTDAKRSNGGT